MLGGERGLVALSPMGPPSPPRKPWATGTPLQAHPQGSSQRLSANPAGTQAGEGPRGLLGSPGWSLRHPPTLFLGALHAGLELAHSGSHHGDPSSASSWFSIPSKGVLGVSTALALPAPHPWHPPAHAPMAPPGRRRTGPFEEPVGLIPWHGPTPRRGSSWSLP